MQKIRVLVQTFTPKGVDPKTDFEFGQRLIWEERTFMTFSRHILDREIVPAWAVIQRNTLGSSDWRSKFAKYGFFGKHVDGVTEIIAPAYDLLRSDYPIIQR